MKKTLKTSKGITLIALIITIIVLLILAVVTINAVNEGGIFGHAQNAADKYTIAAEKEELKLACSEWKMEKYSGNSPDFVTFMNTRLNGKATVSSNGDGTYSVAFSKTGNEYTITENGDIDGPKVITPGITLNPTSLTISPKGEGEETGTGTITATLTGGLSGDITWTSSDTSVITVEGDNTGCTVTAAEGITEGTATITATCGSYTATSTITIGENTESALRKYILGADETGRNLMSIMDMESITFLADPDDAESTVYQNVKFGYGFDEDNMDEENGEVYGYIRYGKDVYKITADAETADTKELTLVNTPSGHLGQYVTYGGIEYIVMAEDSSTVTLISANTLGSVTLGYNDSNATSNVTDLNGDGTVSEGEKGVWSYNNAVNTLVTACKDATGLTVDGSTVISIRSVGNTNVKYTSTEIIGSDNSTYTYEWESAGASSDWYTANGFNSYNMKAEDTNYSADKSAMDSLAITRADDGGEYWLASRRVNSGSSDVNFRMRYIYNRYGYLDYHDVCSLGSSGNANGGDYTYAVRPVITLSSSAINW